MIKLGYIILYVPNVLEAMHFYRDIFSFDIKFISPEEDYGELLTGEIILSFAHSSLGKSNIGDYEEILPTKKPLGIELAFTTDNVEYLYQKIIENGGTSLSAPEVKPWGQNVAYVRDPFGTLLEICTPIN